MSKALKRMRRGTAGSSWTGASGSAAGPRTDRGAGAAQVDVRTGDQHRHRRRADPPVPPAATPMSSTPRETVEHGRITTVARMRAVVLDGPGPLTALQLKDLT